MNKFVLNSFIFTALALVVLALLNLRLEYTTHQNNHFRLQYEEIQHPTINADNVIIGTSHATHGIQPQILDQMGTSFYNFASDGANPEFYLHWYENIFRPYYKKPKYMIIAVEWFFFDSKWLERKYEQDSEYFPVDVFFSNLLGQNEFDKSMLFDNRYPILKYRKTPEKIIEDDSSSRYVISQYKDGFVPYQLNNTKVEEFYPQHIFFDKTQQDDFEQLIRLLLADGVKVVFINTPAYSTNVLQYTNIPIYRYYESLSEKYTIPFINYNLERRTYINSNKQYYVDGGHLNYLGSIEFSKLLMGDLKNIMK